MIKWHHLVQFFLLLILVGSIGGQKVKVQAAPVPVTIDGFDILDPAKWSVDTQNNYVCQTGMSGAGSDGTLGAWGVVEAKNGKLYLYRDVNCAHRFVYVSSRDDYELDTPFFEAEVSTALEDPTGWGVGWGVENLFGLWYVNHYSPPRFEWWGPDGVKRQIDLPLNLQEGFHTYKVSNLQLPDDSLHASFQVLVDGEIKYQEAYTVTLDMLGRSGKIWFGNPVLGQCDGWHSCHWANGTLDETGAGPWPRLAVDDIKVDGYPPIPLPSLNVSPTILTFAPITQGTSGTEQKYTFVYNSGGGTLDWSASESSDWFRISPLSGSSTTFLDGDTIWVALENTSGLAVGNHTQTITVSGQTGAQNSPQTVTVELAINPPPTGGISGYVWQDNGSGTNAGNGRMDSGESIYTSGSWRVSRDGSDGGDMQNTVGGQYNFGNFVVNPASGEPITVSLDTWPGGWEVTGSEVDSAPCSSSGVCTTDLADGGSKIVRFGVWNNPSGWFQARNGDVYGRSVTITLPPDPPGTFCGLGECYDRWFLDAEPSSTAGGVVITEGATVVSEGRVSQRPNGSTPGWNLTNYGDIPWPEAIDEIDATHRGVVSGDIIYAANIVINAANVAGYTNKIVVAGNSLTIEEDVARVDAVLISKGPVLIKDRGVINKPLTINGALYARGFVSVVGDLANNRKPTLLVNYDPRYLLRNVPGLTKARVSWREVKSP